MKEEEIENRQSEIIEEIKADPDFCKFLEAYEDSSVDRFIEQYAYYKACLEHKGNRYQHKEERHMADLMAKAEKCLIQIQMKKLFDLECRWRANQITLPGVEITWDFRFIAENILQHDIPEPVSAEDVALYQEFLHSSYAVMEDFSTFYPFYETIKLNHDNDEEDIPLYFEFLNQRTGASALMLLPDLRGERERFYADLYHDHKKENNPVKPAQPMKPILRALPPELARVAEKFGEKKFARYLRDQWKGMSKNDHRVEWAYYYLIELDEPVPIPNGYDWKEALYEAARNHENQQISQALPTAWEDYKLKKKMNIPFASGKDSWKARREFFVKQILNGRELNGEPRNLDF